MGFFSSFLNPGAKEAKAGYADATGMLQQGETKARGELTTGYDQAGNFLSQAGKGIGAAYDQANNALDTGESKATGYLDPYIQSGGRANALYGDALGLNGTGAQSAFGANYAASDPFRAQNANFATEALMKSLNARGMSGSGYAGEAIARQSLARGSEDYGNYLNRLIGVRDSGQNAANNAASIAGNFAQQRAGLATDRLGAQNSIYGAQAQNATDRGNALSNLSYGNAQQMAGQRIGLGNALAESKSAGINNLIGLGGMALKASGFGGYGMPTGGR
jgi:hypothetical protein